MGWVNRNGQSYYYRSRRINGRVKTEVFSGLQAALESSTDDEAKYRRKREAEERAKEDELDEEIDRLFGRIEDLTAERLNADGFHQHKRQWRRRRNNPGHNREND